MINTKLASSLTSQEPPTVIDVRSGFEYRNGHIPGALHIPLWKLFLRLASLPEDKNSCYVITCEHGPRAQAALGILKRSGFACIELLDGHMSAWRKQGLPLSRGGNS